jgi:hypothetical protein
MDSSGPVTTTAFNSIWNFVLSMLMALVFWNWRTMSDDLKQKANKSDVERELNKVHIDIRDLFALQIKQHADNTERLDKILLNTAHHSRGSGA